MKIVRLSDSCVKIIVSKQEMENLDVSFNDLKTNNFKSKLFLSALVKTLGEQVGDKTYVEVFDLNEEGCVIYFSEIHKSNKSSKKNQQRFLTFETKKPEKLKEFSSKLLRLDVFCVDSKLFTDGESFRVVVEFENNLPESVKRFCEKEFTTVDFENFFAQITTEHSERWIEIVSQNALEIFNEES